MIEFEYQVADLTDLGRGVAVDVEEDRGKLLFKVSDQLSLGEAIQALNVAAESVLSGGHWFQEWKGDIITRISPEHQREGAFTAVPRQYSIVRRSTAA